MTARADQEGSGECVRVSLLATRFGRSVIESIGCSSSRDEVTQFVSPGLRSAFAWMGPV